MRLKQRTSKKVTDQALQAKFTKKGKNEAAKWNKGKEKWKKKNNDDATSKNSKNQNDSNKTNTSSNKNSKKKVNMKEVQCYCCDKFGHYARNCPENKDSNKDEAHLAHSDSDDAMLMATTKLSEDKANVWYLDTGCSNHMTGNKDWFIMDLGELSSPARVFLCCSNFDFHIKHRTNIVVLSCPSIFTKSNAP
jgi:hypothetical protein